MSIDFRHERFTAELLDPRKGFEPACTEVEVRWDPLTGQSCRLLPSGSMPPPAAQDLEALAERSRPTCPFCAERVEHETPRFPEAVLPGGRIRVGEALLFPNLLPYSKWSSVSVYSPERHVLRLEQLTPSLVADNLAAQVEFARAVLAYDPTSVWISINANQLPPSGSSIFHPHLQGAAHPVPTTAQRVFAELDADRVRRYVELERAAGERFIASLGPVDWLASFAPGGLGEIRGVVSGAGSTADLDRQRITSLASGLSAVFRLYARLGFQSFNVATHGVAAGARDPMLVLRVVARGTFGPLERSDVMWSECLHGEVATDLRPERVTELARDLFALPGTRQQDPTEVSARAVSEDSRRNRR
jgi:galactose-1-phosphate uridylyltransferase